MPLPKSSLSQVCRSIADFLSNHLKASANSFRVTIGNPAAVAPSTTETENRLNLFFYRIDPSGYFTGGDSGGTWWLRLHCMVTGFGIAEENVSAGENDLRLLGEALRAFHEKPILPEFAVEDEVFRLQVVFQPLTADELNHIWSTQSGVSYRPSVVYEMALAPVIPKKRTVPGPLVGSIGSEVRAVPEARHAAFTGPLIVPLVGRSFVDVREESWAPAICFVTADGSAQTLSFALDSAALAAFAPAVFIAGEHDGAVRLVWQIWTADKGWKDAPNPVPGKAVRPLLDPGALAAADAEPVELPAGFTSQAGQAVLYAERQFERAADHAAITVRSNPLLITVYKEL
jgi:hypothetical protein